MLKWILVNLIYLKIYSPCTVLFIVFIILCVRSTKQQSRILHILYIQYHLQLSPSVLSIFTFLYETFISTVLLKRNFSYALPYHICTSPSGLFLCTFAVNCAKRKRNLPILKCFQQVGVSCQVSESMSRSSSCPQRRSVVHK